MDMELYSSSLASPSVDAHLIHAYGFSIVEIIHENPKKKTIYFDSIKGQGIRDCYMEMTCDTTDKGGNIKSLIFFADIDVHTFQHTITHPKRPLFSTHFMQIAIVITSRTAVIHSKDLVHPGTAFAGHSQGEFSALAAVANILLNLLPR